MRLKGGGGAPEAERLKKLVASRDEQRALAAANAAERERQRMISVTRAAARRLPEIPPQAQGGEAPGAVPANGHRAQPAVGTSTAPPPAIPAKPVEVGDEVEVDEDDIEDEDAWNNRVWLDVPREDNDEVALHGGLWCTDSYQFYMIPGEQTAEEEKFLMERWDPGTGFRRQGLPLHHRSRYKWWSLFKQLENVVKAMFFAFMLVFMLSPIATNFQLGPTVMLDARSWDNLAYLWRSAYQQIGFMFGFVDKPQQPVYHRSLPLTD